MNNDVASLKMEEGPRLSKKKQQVLGIIIYSIMIHCMPFGHQEGVQSKNIILVRVQFLLFRDFI